MVPCPEGPHPPRLHSEFLPRVCSTERTCLDHVKALLSARPGVWLPGTPFSAGVLVSSPSSLWELPLAGGTSQIHGLVKVGMPRRREPPCPSAPGRPLEACTAAAGSVNSRCSPGSQSSPVGPLHTSRASQAVCRRPKGGRQPLKYSQGALNAFLLLRPQLFPLSPSPWRALPWPVLRLPQAAEPGTLRVWISAPPRTKDRRAGELSGAPPHRRLGFLVYQGERWALTPQPPGPRGRARVPGAAGQVGGCPGCLGSVPPQAPPEHHYNPSFLLTQ